jgi:hypothetical protein
MYEAIPKQMYKMPEAKLKDTYVYTYFILSTIIHIVMYSGFSIHDGTLLYSRSQYTTVKHSQKL